MSIDIRRLKEIWKEKIRYKIWENIGGKVKGINMEDQKINWYQYINS